MKQKRVVYAKLDIYALILSITQFGWSPFAQ
jgi:hypothetical protein